MRQFIDGSGNDSTSAVSSFLTSAAARNLLLADLYLLGELTDPNAVFLTNYNSALAWPVWGTFNPTNIQRGKITSQIGFKVDNLDVTWRPPLAAFGASVATSNQYQKAQAGFYDNWKFRLWRCLMPTPGDAQTYGATPWFGGYIGDTEIGRGYVKFSVESFLNIVNQNVPPNVIEPSNILSGYAGNVPPLTVLQKTIPTFTVIAPSNTNVILGDTIGPIAHQVYPTNLFTMGFLVFLSGTTLAGYWQPIAANQASNPGGSPNYNQFQLYGSFPFAPTPGDTFFVSSQMPLDLLSTPAGYFKGFPYVPDPVTAI